MRVHRDLFRNSSLAWAIACFTVLTALTAAPRAHAEFSQSGIYVGTDFGLVQKSGVTAPETSNGGFGLGLKGGYSQAWSPIIGDIGLGYVFDSLKKNGVSIQTRAFYSELGLRYRLTSHWSVGPEMNLLFGQDVSFSDSVSQTKSSALLLGARAMYEISNWRFGLQYMADVNIANRRVTRVQAVIEWIFGSAHSDTVATVARTTHRTSQPVEQAETRVPEPEVAPKRTVEKTVEKPAAKPVEKPFGLKPTPKPAEPTPPKPPMVTEKPAPVPTKTKPKPIVKPVFTAAVPVKPKVRKAATNETLNFNLSQAGLEFPVGTTKLDTTSLALLNHAAMVLIEYNAQWSHIVVEGYSDSKGDASTNRALSAARAQAVVVELVANGVDQSKITSVGYGQSKPLDRGNSPEAQAKNRRIEIKIQGTKVGSKFSKAFQNAIYP